jgi:cytochrome c biogenesis protein CcmG/thiol:disulfide interchange protein DsbE
MSDVTSAPAKPRRWPYILPLAIILAIGAVFSKRLIDVEGGLEPNALPTVVLHTPVPEFDLEPLPGYADGLKSADLKGQVYLINFWGSWCATCVYEHPVLLDIAKSGEVPLYGIAWRDKPEKSIAWLNKYRDPFTKIGQDPHSKAAIGFGVAQAPETFLVDKKGIIRYKQPGPITPQAWRDDILPKIKQLKAEQ